ncbi:MAG: methionyl-tRNA formyltransferase [Actinomycetota bacterium]|jgi:methionyl-tRNA formyltransferase|nr:methionyl-tRNA formyltransferase [Actinomycetota bacterium]
MAELVFLGTPEAAVAPLRAVVDAGHRVRLVVSRPDRRRGRGASLVPSPVKQAASELGLPVTDRLEEVASAGAELGVVVAYGALVPSALLEKVPMVNLHFSLLPRWRGAAPVERAILAGDAETGVCLMRLDAGLDTGPVLARRSTPIHPDEHAGALRTRLASMGADLLVDALAGGLASLGPGEAQRGTPTYAAKIDAGELRIDWEQPAEHIVRQVRLDRAHTSFRGRRLRVLDAVVDVGASGSALPGTLLPGGVVAAGEASAVALRQVQPDGRRPMDVAAWWIGARPEPGERLGSLEAAASGAGHR